MSHFLTEYGRFAFLTEILIKSLFYGTAGPPKVKCQILQISPNVRKNGNFHKQFFIFFTFIGTQCVY